MLEVLGGIFLIGLIVVFAFTGVAATTLAIFAVIAIVIATIFALLLGTAVLVFKIMVAVLLALFLQFIFGCRYRRQHRALLKHLRIQHERPDHFLHDLTAVVRIIYMKVSVIADPVAEPAKHAAAGRMERHDPDAFRSVSHQPVHTFPHLSGRLVGKSDRHDIPGAHTHTVNQIGGPAGQHPCLSGSRSRQDQQRSLRRLYGLQLLFIQIFQIILRLQNSTCFPPDRRKISAGRHMSLITFSWILKNVIRFFSANRRTEIQYAAA